MTDSAKDIFELQQDGYLLNPKDFPLGFFNKTPEIESVEAFEVPAHKFFDANKLKLLDKTIEKQKTKSTKDQEDFLKIYDIEPEKVNDTELSSDINKDILLYKNNNDIEALNRIINELNPVIERGIQIFGNGNELLRGHAKLIVKNAIDNYDPTKGDLKTYVLLHLQRLRRIQPQVSDVVNVSEGMKILITQLAEAEKELTDKLNRPPTDQELADYMKISKNKLKKIREARGSIAESNIEGMAAITVGKEEEQNQARELWIQTIYLDLDPTEQYILDCVYGRNGREKKTLQQIADDLKLPLSTVHAKLKKIENLINMVEEI